MADCRTGRPLPWRRVAAAACLIAAASATAAPAQPPNRSASKFYPDFSDTADARLRSAASHAQDGQWAEAVDIYQKVIQQFGEKVARLPKDDPAVGPAGDSQLYVDVRQFCQRKVAELPPEARAVYRSRVDGQAERWFKQGEAGRDRTLLRRVVDQAFCSSWGDDAAELLGDFAFQDGRFSEALANYRRVVPDGSGSAAGLVHPDPSVDLARVAAKKLLTRAALGENVPGADDLAAFGKAFPNTSGELAGRDGPYLDALTDALRSDNLTPPSQPDGRWPTFAGSPTRSRVVAGSIDIGSVQWRVELEPVSASRGSRMSRGIIASNGPTTPDQKLAYHPIVVGDQVVVSDETRITAYNLNDRPETAPGSLPGAIKEAWKHEEDQGNIPRAPRFSPGIPRFTLTAQGDRIFARMGPTSGPSMGRMGAGSTSYLVALDRSTDGKLLWKRPAVDVASVLKPAEGLVRTVGFEGTPVSDGRSVFVAMTDRREQTSTYVACLDAESGASRWVRYLGAASDSGLGFGMGGMGAGGGGGDDSGHRLLTLDGPTVYYQTNLGAVVALDAEGGAIQWVATYPRQERGGSARDRDLNPAVFHDGLVIVAPDDAAAVYAFDAASGRLVWKTDPLPDEVKLAHLLGVAKGRLVATGDRVLLFDVKTGKLVHTWPDNGHGFESYGRGVLAGDKIYWPTRTEIHVLDQATGLRSEPPIKLQESFQTTGGNLAVGDGYLIVAQADQLVVFCQNRRLIQRYREEIARAPDEAAPYFRMARAAEATGDDALALASLASAVAKVRPSEAVDGVPILEASRDQKYRLLVKTGDASRLSKDFAAAEGRYHAAAEAARGDRDRLRARLAEAEVQLARGHAARAVDTLQSLLSEGRLRYLTVAVEEGRRSIRSDLLIGDRLATVVKSQGREVYAAYDREARELLVRGRAERDARLIEEVARSYPVAEVVPESLEALGRHHAEHKSPGDAARAYKRLLAAATSDDVRGRALVGLARAYEEQKLWVPSRDAYARALARFPKVTLPDEGGGSLKGGLIGPLVAARLGAAPFDRMIGDRAEPTVPVPLVRRIVTSAGAAARPIAADGVPPSPEASRVFLAQGGAIRPALVSGAGGDWTADLGGTAVWVGYLTDRVLAATESRLTAIDLRTGSPLWRFESGPSAPGRRTPDPFARPEDAAKAPADSAAGAGPLQGFRIVGGRVICLRGEHELIALDADTGLIEWSYKPGGGAINPHVLVGPARIVLQTRAPNAILVLDTVTGRRRSEFPQGDETEAWPRDPLPIDDDRVAVVTDSRTVALFDVSRGVSAWVYRQSTGMPKTGPPRLLGDAERLLVVHDGYELIRLDASTGERRWSRPLGTENLGDRPDSLALDGDRVYWASAQALTGASLTAASLNDGSTVWSHYLAGPSSGWSIDLTERCVLAFPGAPGRDGNEIEGFPLVFRRRDSGQIVQRLLFPVPVSEVAVRLSPGGVVVATQGASWALGGRKAAVDGRGVGR